MTLTRRTLDLFAHKWLRRSAGWMLLPLLAIGAVGVVISQSAAPVPPAIPGVNLASEPLYARGARAKPTLLLALSVEFPTVGAQYLGVPRATQDATYSPSTEYVGYFDAESCYLYNNASDATQRRFYRTGAATSRGCGGTGFSGNFMNWASSSAIDILRYGLTGGDRVVDTPSLTVLQRAVLPNSGGSFWNGQNFPSKKLLASLATDALPSSMLPSPAGDVYVANCLNRIHFGTQATGSCGSPGANSNLGVPIATGTSIGPVTNYNGALPSTFSTTPCAAENGTCSFSGVLEVAYGDTVHNQWIFVPVANGIACSNNMTGSFNDPDPGTVKACYTRPYTGTWVAPGSVSVLSSDPFFYARVQVCDSNASGALIDPRADLCLRYPNGNYKPVGNLQKYSDRIRVAAFGYLNDNTGNPNERYGGVLRAPMKYAGPKYFDANFSLVSGANPNREWDENSGVFIQNPDAATGPNSGTSSNWPGLPISGVTNYLNQFGRTGVFGQYKTYDPVGELYYESLRYLQGLQPTGAATTGITDAMRDGFPVYETWSDPHPAVSGMSDYACVKNNIVGIGDVNTHNDKTIPGNARTGNDLARSSSDADNEPNFVEWTKVVGSFESNHNVGYVDGSGASRVASNIASNSPYNTSRWGMESQDIGADHASYYMAGMAYWANTHDIRGVNWSDVDKRRLGMRVRTFMLDVNEFAGQTDAATHKNNQFFLAAKYGGFSDVTGTGNPFRGKKQTGDTDFPPTNVNWEKTAGSGEARNYFLSSSARDVLTSLSQIFEQVAREANSIAGGAISTQRLTSDGGYIYQAQFDPTDWSGDLVASRISLSGNGVSISGTGQSTALPAWTAGSRLDAKVPSTRKIFIGKTAVSGGQVANDFMWGSLDPDAQNALRAPANAASGASLDAEAVGQARLNFLRGDRSLEAGAPATAAASSPVAIFRKRGSVLGDIVNSGVAYLPPPSLQYPDSAYADFYSNLSARKKALFVGANDGMLHSFDADTGDELFAYIPSWVASRLSALTSTNYAHQTYVDGSPAVADAKVGSTWKSVLVGGTGAGGQGVFALDVSNPDNMSASKAMWEFTDRDDVDMGNVIGRPQILKFRMTRDSAASDRYFAVVASGVNNYVGDGRFNTDGAPTLFLLDLNKSATDPWTLGTNYFKVRFPESNPAPSPATARGLANFTARTGVAGQVTAIYAGDLQGNLWKLDFSQASSGDWSMNNLSYFKSGTVPIPMYVAKDANGVRQPITMPPALAFGPNRSIIVAFGTGKFLETSDSAGPHSGQSVYAVFDNNTATPDSASPLSAIAGRARLQAGSIGSNGRITVPTFAWGRPATNGDTNSRAGWYFDFPNSATSGERQISGMAIFAGQFAFGSVIPAVNSCDSGNGNLYVVDILSGGGQSEASTVGILGEPFVIQIGSVLGKKNSTGGQIQATRYQIILQGSSSLSGERPPDVKPSIVSRVSWREITNYDEIRRKP